METPTEAVLGRREQGKAERRQAIIEAATTKFLHDGYGRTTMSAIAKAMGGSKGTLWSYFSSKEELFAAVLHSATDTFRSVMTATLDPRLEPNEVLDRFCRAFIARITSADAIALNRLVIAEVERFPEVGTVFDDVIAAHSLALVSDYFAAAIVREQTPPFDPKDAARTLLGLATGGYHRRVLWGVQQPSTSAATEEAEFVIRQFLRCYPTLAFGYGGV